MRLRPTLYHVFAFTVNLDEIVAQTVTDPTRRAELALSALQIWYNAGTGLWDTTGWWNSANVMTMISNLAKYDSNSQLQDLATRIFANTLEQAPAKNPQPGVESQNNTLARDALGEGSVRLYNESTTGYTKFIGSNGFYTTTYPIGWDKSAGAYVDVKNLKISKARQKVVSSDAEPDPQDWLDGFYDDDLWWALGWIGAFDITGDDTYLTLAEGIFNAVAAKAWPTKCGNGGIWWSYQQDYMNAIANELFLSTAAHLANRASNKTGYIDWAKKELAWFLNSGMINSNGTINDGLTDNCKNNGDIVWSYNQGVILGGLVELNKASPNSTYLSLAASIAKAAIDHLSDEDGILHDVCEPNCGGDGTQFKGIFTRNLQLLHEAAPDDIYSNFIQDNVNSIWDNDRDQTTNRLSIDWSGPFVSPANASTHSSAMDTLVAAITVK